MIEQLDAMVEDFRKQKDEDKYKWIARLRKYLTKNEELKGEYSHPLFVEVIEFHIEQLQQERDLLQKFLTAYEDRKLDGIDHQPTRYQEGSQDVSEAMAVRIREIDGYIKEYSEDLKKRSNTNYNY